METLASRAEYNARTAKGERLDFDCGRIIPIPDGDSVHDGIKAHLVGELNRQLPDLVIEITSAGESAEDLVAKTELFLSHGCKAFWVVDTEERAVQIHKSNEPTRFIPFDGVIEGEQPVPEFRLPVAALFA